MPIQVKRRNTHKNKHKNKYKSITREEAGKAIAAGGFGCVFRPPIDCAGPKCKDIVKAPFVTKVMKKENAVDEMQEVNKVIPILSKIPHSEKYFLATDIFKPSKFGPLSAEDIQGFDRKCSNLTRYGIKSTNVNNKLDSLGAIYIPDGGISLKNFIDSCDFSIDNIKQIGIMNWALMELIQKAIVPMNAAGLVHLDIKSDNILMGKDFMANANNLPNPKIIDWGLSVISLPTDKQVPNGAKHRPFQFNTPPSIIMLNPSIVIKLIRDTCDLKINTFPYPIIKSLSTRIISYASSIGFAGHLDYINSSLNAITKLFAKYASLVGLSTITETCFHNATLGVGYIIDHISEVIDKFSVKTNCGNNNTIKSLKFDSAKFYKEVFSKNCDIWGLLTVYDDFISKSIKNSSFATRINVFLAMYEVIFKYCYSSKYAAIPIPISELLEDMKAVSIACGVPNAPIKKNTELQQDVLNNHLLTHKKCPAGYRKIKNTPNCKRNIVSFKISSQGLSAQGPSAQSPSAQGPSAQESHIILTPSKRCPRGYVRKRGTRKCIKKH